MTLKPHFEPKYAFNLACTRFRSSRENATQLFVLFTCYWNLSCESFQLSACSPDSGSCLGGDSGYFSYKHGVSVVILSQIGPQHFPDSWLTPQEHYEGFFVDYRATIGFRSVCIGSIPSLFVHIIPEGFCGLENLSRVSVNISGESKNG